MNIDFFLSKLKMLLNRRRTIGVNINLPKNHNPNIPVFYLQKYPFFFLGIKYHFFFLVSLSLGWYQVVQVAFVIEKPFSLSLVWLAVVSLAHVDLLWPC